VKRPALTSLLLVALVCGVAAPTVAAQSSPQGERPPTELWDEFPLKQPAPGAAGESGDRPAAGAPRRSDEADDGSPSTITFLLAGLGVLAGAGLAVRAAVGLRRRRSRAVGKEAPAAPPTTTSEDPAPAKPAAPDRSETPTVVPLSTAGKPQDGAAAAGPQARLGAVGQRAIGYASVSAADDLNNAELKVQVRLIQEACQRRGFTLVKTVRDVESHASSDLRRPGLTYALDRLAARDASCLVVTSIERLTRTAANLGALLGWLTECDARLVVIDLDLDTGTHEGQLGARALATVGGLERRKLEERTRKGLEAARHMGRSGRPAVSDRPSLKQRIADMRAQGMTLQAIADTLNDEGVPTLRGGAEWRPSSVQAAAGYKRPRRKSVLQAPAPPRNKRA
jgi:DNA invertase Pin-like site-specific DNA recombinase